MTVGDIQNFLFQWAPKQIAWERDNVGLQVADASARVRGILVALDVTEAVVEEARRKKTNLIISHHPLLFQAPLSITTQTSVNRCIRLLLANNIHACAAHTNLDFASGGTSFALAEALKLQNVEFLRTSYKVEQKIVTFVPEEHVDRVAEAMAKAGAGRIGNYEHCSFRMEGIGTFKGNERSHPAVGKKLQKERTQEVRLEMIARRWDISGIVQAMKAAHPYEEVAYDIYPLDNECGDVGMGVIGRLDRPQQLRSFLGTIKRALKIPALRCAGTLHGMVRTVAACGGSGSELINAAIERGADAFITADIRYHTFHEAGDRIALIDAGHYETEQPVVHAVVRRLQREVRHARQRIPVFAARTRTNPITYV